MFPKCAKYHKKRHHYMQSCLYSPCLVTVTRLYSRADNSRLAPQGSCMLGNVYFYAPWQEKYTLVKLCKSTILGFPSILAFYY